MPKTYAGKFWGRSTVGVLVGSGAWFFLALVAGLSGVLVAVRPLFLQTVLLTLVVALLALFYTASGFRRWALSVDIRGLVLVHVSRLVGIYFLLLYSRGQLPYAFAVPGGWGDIAVAATAVAVSALSPTSGAAGWGVFFLWNVFGLADILFVVGTAARLGTAVPESMAALTKLPLSLLPTFLVPIIISTHVIMLLRLLASRREGYRTF